MKSYNKNIVIIKAIFKGEHLSLGFANGKVYHLIIEHEKGKNIIVTEMSHTILTCEYDTMINFLNNWS